jgi:hypothetical protein
MREMRQENFAKMTSKVTGVALRGSSGGIVKIQTWTHTFSLETHAGAK